MSETRPIGLDFISVVGLAPLDYVALAADLGAASVTMGLQSMSANPYDVPAWSLRTDAQLRRETAAALRDRGIALGVGEGFVVMPGGDLASAPADLDLLAELGAQAVNIVVIDGDRARSFDIVAAFAELAEARSLRAMCEFMPGVAIGDLSSAVALAHHVGRPSFSLVIDAMHLFRSGGTAAELAAVDPAIIGYAQVCDVPLVSAHDVYGMEALHHRLPPGDGELPLAEFLAALPAGVPLGVEVPMLDRALAGERPEAWLRPSFEATRALLA